MNELMIFENPEFGKIRTVEIDGAPWFVGKDMAEALRYSNSRKALADHVDEEDKMDGVTIRDAIGRDQMPVLINESGLYSLVLSSQLPGAKKFKRWVTSEVLPSIRKHGTYTATSKELQAIFMLDSRTVEHDRRITALEETMVVDYGQQRTLAVQVNKSVLEALGGLHSPAYCDKNIRGRTYSECNRDIRQWFRVNSRNNIPRKRFDEAVDYIENWKPSTNMTMAIQQVNRQESIYS